MVSCYKVYGTTRSVYLFFIIILSLFSVVLTPVTSPGEDADYLTTLIESARGQRLHEDRYWEVFLHYKPSWSGKKSLIDDPAFFLAHDGKTSPASELEATLRGFFQDQKADEEQIADEQEMAVETQEILEPTMELSGEIASAYDRIRQQTRMLSKLRTNGSCADESCEEDREEAEREYASY